MKGDSGWTIERVLQSAFDTKVHGAEEEIGQLIDEWEQIGVSNPARASSLDSAVSMLRTWNRRGNAGSEAMTMFGLYHEQLRILEATAYPHFRALEIVVNDRRRMPPRAWGEYRPLRRVPVSVTADGMPTAIPTAAAPSHYGIMFSYDALSGAQSYVWSIDVTTGAAVSVFSYGESAVAGSAHWFDQAPMYAFGRWKPMGVPGGGKPYSPAEGH
jgi:hypothetical protein